MWSSDSDILCSDCILTELCCGTALWCGGDFQCSRRYMAEMWPIRRKTLTFDLPEGPTEVRALVSFSPDCRSRADNCIQSLIFQYA